MISQHSEVQSHPRLGLPGWWRSKVSKGPGAEALGGHGVLGSGGSGRHFFLRTCFTSLHETPETLLLAPGKGPHYMERPSTNVVTFYLYMHISLGALHRYESQPLG